MSLFKICTWWKTQCPDILENYDSSSLLCCRFGLFDNEKDFIIVGSHDGNLSIFNSDSNYETLGEYKPTDLILGLKFNDPIIGLLCGKFSGTQRSENSNQLAILHLYKISIYNLLKVDGISDEGNSYSLQILTEHNFKVPAFGACIGPFGKILNRDFICVTHMDGNLTFYEQDGIIYNINMPGFSLPTVIKYVPRIDSFVRVNFSWDLECFSYQDLSQISTAITPTWSIGLGEFILDICQVQLTNEKSVIMVLGEHNYFSISDEGQLNFINKLDYSPKCFCSFINGWYWEPNSSLITAIVSDNSTLLIYNEMKLIWAAQLEQIPVAIKRSNCSLPGAIVTLTETGYLHIGYLGSEPLIFEVPPLNMKDMNFEKAHNELLEIEKEIKNGIELEGIDGKIENTSATEELEIEFTILSTVETCTFEIESKDLKGKNNLMCAAGVRFKAKTDIEQIQITFLMSDKIQSSNSLITINNVAANSSQMINTYFYITEKVNISTLKVETFVSYINKQGIPRILRKAAYLPLSLFYTECAPQKDATIKLIISLTNDTKNSIYKLTNIFSNFFKKKLETQNMQALGLKLFHTEAIVTIVAAKNNPNRFRIQSDCLEAIPAVLETMINYATNFDASSKTTNISDNMLMLKKDILKTERNRNRNQYNRKDIVMAPSIPYDEIIKRIENHHDIQKELRKQSSLMDALWNQFKLFQISLQSKKEDEQIDGLMMLIEKNYDDLVKEGDILIALKIMEHGKRIDLSCAISLLNKIITYSNLDLKIINMVTSVISYPIEDWIDKYWEETLDPAINTLHHHPILQNSSKTSAKIGDITTSAITKYSGIFDFDKFKRHFTTLMERLQRLSSTKGDQQQHKSSITPEFNNSETIIKSNYDNAISKIVEQEMNETDISKEVNINIEIKDEINDKKINSVEKQKKSDWAYSELSSTDALMLGISPKL